MKRAVLLLLKKVVFYPPNGGSFQILLEGIYSKGIIKEDSLKKPTF
jgi:hypothetical protein